MSVIAVRRYKDKVVMASDSQTTWGYNKTVDCKDDSAVNPSKIWKHNGIVVGEAGSVSESVLFQIYTKTRKPSAPSAEGIMDFLVEFEDWGKKRNTNFKVENHALIIFEGKIFQTLGLSVREIKEYNAVGSGMFLALGAMYKGATPEEAIEVAKEFDLFCSGKTDVIEVNVKNGSSKETLIEE